MCRWALISWPINNRLENVYLILGEIYNNDVKNDVKMMSEFCKDLEYLYPFRFSARKKICSNMEDIFYMRKKYSLTVKFQLVGKVEKDILTFHRPVLYDIDCFVPIFSVTKIYSMYRPKSDLICVIVPSVSPVERGELLEEAIEYGPEYFVVMGDKYNDNKDSLATLMTRFLLSRKIPYNQIIKTKNTECILDVIEVVNLVVNRKYDLLIACKSSIIGNISRKIRFLKRSNKLDKKIYYICT